MVGIADTTHKTLNRLKPRVYVTKLRGYGDVVVFVCVCVCVTRVITIATRMLGLACHQHREEKMHIHLRNTIA